MKYKINELAKLAGVSTRTLRYYDQIGLFKSSRDNDSNYRIYNSDDVDNLWQILLYKKMGVRLSDIKNLMLNSDNEKKIIVLKKHLEELTKEQESLKELILNVNNSIKYLKGELIMNDKDKFKGLKENLIKQNEVEFKEEVVRKWGLENYERSKNQFKNMTEEQYLYFVKLNEEIISNLIKLKKSPTNKELEKLIAILHKEWISLAWGWYDREIHLKVVDMYIEDQRFSNYYDIHEEGITKLLNESVKNHI